MDDVAGVWDLSMRTPLGTIEAVYTLTAGPDGLTGTAAGRGEVVPLTDLAADGARVTWRQSVTRPMRLHLEFDVTVDGDALAGHSRAGRLPRTAVTGVRRREESA